MVTSWSISDNTIQSQPLPMPMQRVLSPYSGLTLQELNAGNNNLLIFPHCLRINIDKIHTQSLFELKAGCLKTGNVMGYFGINGVHISIYSRFDSPTQQFFLYYLLQKVFGINLINLPTKVNQENLGDFAMFLFPFCLKRALAQGILKTYQLSHCNDYYIRGAIDIANHLRANLPFSGKVATRSRELTTNNAVMHLIRHTIEFLSLYKSYAKLLCFDSETCEAVNVVKKATPTYDRLEMQNIIAKNLRRFSHPYYTEYSTLQKICLQILRHQKVSYGCQDQDIYGIIFDGAWLWEEYLATIISADATYGFEHPNNVTKHARRYLYKNHKGHIYPDFIKNELIIDAKYKKMDVLNRINREDRFQMIAYMHVLQAKYGYFAFPTQSEESQAQCEGELNGYGGEVGVLPFIVSEKTSTFQDFVEKMELEEKRFVKRIEGLSLR